MKIKILLLYIFLFILSSQIKAQTLTLKGVVNDTISTPLSGASVVLLNSKDSLLEKFAITQEDGSFLIKRVPKGEYILQASFIGYQTYSEAVSLAEDQTLAPIILEPILQDINEVTVEAERIPIQIDGDTIKYNADAFATRPNANVEELLKKLPGVEVARDGSIRAQGEEVSKVLVDGKEFFGDDPQIATKNLPADIVDQVQVFDEESEAARFTGVDDGEREKTINLSLKEGKNKGVFGNIEAGYGTEDRYSSKANVNRFTDKLQFSAIGRLNNVNEQGFSIQDYLNMMGGLQAAMSGGFMFNPSDFGVSLNGEDQTQGFTTSGALGTNLNYDFSKKTDLSLNYFYNYLNREEDLVSNRTSFLDMGEFTSEEESFKQNQNRNHRLNSRFKHEIDSTQNIQLRLNLGFNDRNLDRNSFQKNFDSNQELQNSSDQENRTENENFDLTANLLYRKRFQKKGRSMLGNIIFDNRSADGLNRIQADNFFAGMDQFLNQRQIVDNSRWNYTGRLTYTEPIGKSKFLSFNYRRQNYEERMDKDFFDIVGEQLTRNELLSNQFISDYVYDRGGLALQMNSKKSNLRLGLDLQQSRLIGDFLSELPNVDRKFSNWLPSLSWNYDFKDAKSMSIRYQTNLREPTIQQLQPVVDNSNPLSIYVGNPDLKPSYNHNLSIQSMWFDQFSFTSIFAFANIVYTKNQITNARQINENLQQVIQPINVDDNLALNGQASFSTPIRAIKSKIDIRANFNYNKGILFVNNIENDLDQLNGNLTLALSNRKQDVLALELGSTIGYTDSRYSVSENFNQNFFNQSYFMDVSLNIKNKWTIASDISHTVYPTVNFAQEQTFTLWRASISRTFFQDERATLKLSVFDLLNQNIGINRTANANFVQNEQVVSLGRYFMLSCIYRIKRFGGS